METGNVHVTIGGERPHAHMMMSHDRGIDTDLDPSASGGLSITVEVHEGSPFTIGPRASDRDHLHSNPRTAGSPIGGRTLAHAVPLGRTPTTLPTT